MIQAEAQILLYLADHEGNMEIYLSKPFEYEGASKHLRNAANRP